LPLYRRALAGIERLYGPEHPATRTIRGLLEIVAAAATGGIGAAPSSL
jgi:hypothetical protein